nr:DUF2357 domain-containing protein [Acetobacter persici]
MTINLKKIYFEYRVEGSKARVILEQQDWYCRIADFDPKTGDALQQGVSSVLARIADYAAPKNDTVIRDRLWRIVEHCRHSIERLFHALNESPHREHALLPVHAVRELDANSFIKLSNRPGRTVREKLAGKPYMQAVRRFQSVDLPENRLLKSFVRHLAELLEVRLDSIGHEDELLPKIHSWLCSGEAQAIGNWDNLPPNNTLLSHQDYRRVWDGWRWLQTLDDDIARDCAQLEARTKTMDLWTGYAQLWSAGKHLFSEMLLTFDYETFEILPWFSRLPLVHVSRQHISRLNRRCVITDPVCVDFTALRPCYASSADQVAQSLPDTFLWQQWRRDAESVDLELFHSDAVWLHPQSITISMPDLLFSKDNISENFDRAARAFTNRLRNIFRSETLYWVVPDFLSDFELETIRRNLNACFANAEPLPRSVAAIFAQADPARIKGEGYAIVVVDTIGSKICAIKLQAKFDEDLKKRLPITRGFYWERCPPVIITNTDGGKTELQGYDIPTVDAQKQWHDAFQPTKSVYIDPDVLKRDLRVGNFAFCINLTESPVTGGIYLHALQQQAGDIPLWRDQIPELSIKVRKEGIYQRLHLVSRGTMVKPVRGKPVSIPVGEDFTLPAGKPHYLVPLSIGSDADDLGFSARLNSPAFPLKNDVPCELNLTFEYGADDPYKLVFTPQDKSFPPVRATWQRTEDIIITDAPAPEYPQPKTWEELENFPKDGGSETSNLLVWVLREIARLKRDLDSLTKPRATGWISQKWGGDRNGKYFTFASCRSAHEPVFIHQNSFVRGLTCTDFVVGDEISFVLEERSDGRYLGLKVARYEPCTNLDIFDEEEREIIRSIRKKLYFPIIQVWRDGRSISDSGCPQIFATTMKDNCEYLVTLLSKDTTPDKVKSEIGFLLCCMHKDICQESFQWIFEQINHGNIREKRTVGFALGDVSEPWQQALLSQLVANPTTDVMRVFSYAIWHEQSFVEKFSLAELQDIVNSLSIMMNNIQCCPPRKHEKDKRTERNWARSTVEPLELLLGLLRTRVSSSPEIQMLLQPHQKTTKEFAKQVERVTDIVLNSNIPLFSHLQLNIQKPEGDLTPDLLYALRLYLYGDNGADAIHISGVSDNNFD